MTPSSVVLLVQTAQGDTTAVRFASAQAARDWEDAHPEVEAIGCAVVVSRKEALALS